MTQDELCNYIKLNDAFNKRCSEICEILRPLSISYKYANTFEIHDDYVEFTGDEYFRYDGYYEHSGEFPLRFIYTSNGEIEKYVSNELAEIEREKELIRPEVERQKLKAEVERQKLKRKTGKRKIRKRKKKFYEY